jgi:hypothetical protein
MTGNEIGAFEHGRSEANYETLAALFDALMREGKEIMTRAAEVRLQSEKLRAAARLHRREGGCWREPP